MRNDFYNLGGRSGCGCLPMAIALIGLFAVIAQLLESLLLIFGIMTLLGVVIWLLKILYDNSKQNNRMYVFNWSVVALITISIVVGVFYSNNTSDDTYSNNIKTTSTIATKASSHKKYYNKTEEERADSVVSLSFHKFVLGEKINANLLRNRYISNLKTERYLNVVTYQYKDKISIDNKLYTVNVDMRTLSDTVGVIEVVYLDDIYNTKVLPLYESKYGEKIIYGWKYANQSIRMVHNKPQRVIWHPELKKHIYTKHYDFKDITITYEDYKLESKIRSLLYQKRQEEEREKERQDSIKKAIETQRRIDQQKKDGASI